MPSRQVLQSRKRRPLRGRTALGLDHPPAVRPQFLDEFMHQARLTDARVANEGNHPAMLDDVFGGSPQGRNLAGAPDEPREIAPPADAPTRRFFSRRSRGAAAPGR